MKLKLDEQGHVVLTDGKPVYIAEDGKELAFDAAQMYGKVTSLTKEAGENRLRAETAEGKIKEFAGIESPAAAIKALEMVKSLDEGKLVLAGKVDEIKAGVAKAFEGRIEELSRSYEGKVTDLTKRNGELEGTLYSEMVGGAFARSKFVSDKFAIPADLVRARFGSQFGIENGKIYAVDSAGQKLYSRSRPGELADFDESLDILVGGYEFKDQILKGSGAKGGGSQGVGNGGMQGGKKTISREAWQQLPPAEQAVAAREMAVVDN
jgi:hypothetical protein